MSWKKHLSKLFAPRPKVAPSKPNVQIGLEALEDRWMPAAISLSGAGVITINGAQYNDIAKVEMELNNPNTTLDDRIKVSLSNDFGSLTVWYDM